jgi:hypothetical protein
MTCNGKAISKVTGCVRGHSSISLPLLSSPTLPLFICISPTPLYHLQGPHCQGTPAAYPPVTGQGCLDRCGSAKAGWVSSAEPTWRHAVSDIYTTDHNRLPSVDCDAFGLTANVSGIKVWVIPLHTPKADNFCIQSPTTFQMSTHRKSSTFHLLFRSYLSSIRQALDTLGHVHVTLWHFPLSHGRLLMGGLVL